MPAIMLPGQPEPASKHATKRDGAGRAGHMYHKATCGTPVGLAADLQVKPPTSDPVMTTLLP